MERVVAKNGVVFYRSRLIPCPHGFSTRLGGVSLHEHTRSLNLGVERGDSLDTVLHNLSLFSDAIGVDARQIISVPQIHSTKIRRVGAEHGGEGFYKASGESCDGYITTEPNVVLGVRTADCVPILLYAPANKGFGGCVMALHAGWRGTAGGIVKRAVMMASELGADIKDIRAAIGPSIGSCCYTVKDDFYEAFGEMAGDTLRDKYVVSTDTHGIWRADLQGVNKELLLLSGLCEENIDACSACTCCNHNEFYSHRYTGGLRGTMLSCIKLS